jgi:hypothetical protein
VEMITPGKNLICFHGRWFFLFTLTSGQLYFKNE